MSHQETLFPGAGPTEREVDLVALHEAGHAVLLTLDGGEVRAVALDPAGGGVHGRRWTPTSILAGIAVERVRGCRLHPAGMRRDGLRVMGWREDVRAYRRHRGSGRRLRTDLEAAEARVREHGDVIRRVADALLERGRLEGDEVRSILGGP